MSFWPSNPEGISFIHHIKLTPERMGWLVNSENNVDFSAPADRHHISNYQGGDVSIHLNDREDQEQAECDVGMATAAALFKLEPGKPRTLIVNVPLECTSRKEEPAPDWANSLLDVCRLRIPDKWFQFLYDAGFHIDTAWRRMIFTRPLYL